MMVPSSFMKPRTHLLSSLFLGTVDLFDRDRGKTVSPRSRPAIAQFASRRSPYICQAEIPS